MKKKYLLIILIIFITVISPRVDAASKKKTCPPNEMKVYKELAAQVTANYELVSFMEEYGDYSKVPDGANIQDYYYNIIIDNLSEELYIEFGAYTKYYKDSKNGRIVVDSPYSGGAKLTIKIYANAKGDCKGVLVRSITLRLPYYNIYSIYPECEGNIGKYKICSPDIDTSKYLDDDFREIVKKEEEDYKKKHEQQEENKKEDKWYIKIVKWYKENSKTTIPGTIALVVLILLIIIKVKYDNKHKIKVDLGDI